jgi:hypothetical protein
MVLSSDNQCESHTNSVVRKKKDSARACIFPIRDRQTIDILVLRQPMIDEVKAVFVDACSHTVQGQALLRPTGRRLDCGHHGIAEGQQRRTALVASLYIW